MRSFEARLVKLEFFLGNTYKRLDTLGNQVGECETNVVAVIVKGRL